MIIMAQAAGSGTALAGMKSDVRVARPSPHSVDTPPEPQYPNVWSKVAGTDEPIVVPLSDARVRPGSEMLSVNGLASTNNKGLSSKVALPTAKISNTPLFCKREPLP